MSVACGCVIGERLIEGCQWHWPRAEHPLVDPGDGRTECDTCGKWVHLVIHSCNGVPVTDAAIKRMRREWEDDFRLQQIDECKDANHDH